MSQDLLSGSCSITANRSRGSRRTSWPRHETGSDAAASLTRSTRSRSPAPPSPTGSRTSRPARLSGPSLEIRLIHQHHQRLIKQRTALINDLRWNLHDLWPEFKVPARRLRQPSWQQAASRKLQHGRTSARVRVARDELRRVRELTHAINDLVHELTELITDTAPQLLAETGIGPITAASLIGEIADAQRFASDAQLARTAGCAPIPVCSGRTDRHRPDRGSNRQLNSTLHMIAITRMRLDPATALYIAKKRTAGRTDKEAIRCLKRYLIRRIWRLLRDPASARTALIC